MKVGQLIARLKQEDPTLDVRVVVNDNGHCDKVVKEVFIQEWPGTPYIALSGE